MTSRCSNWCSEKYQLLVELFSGKNLFHWHQNQTCRILRMQFKVILDLLIIASIQIRHGFKAFPSTLLSIFLLLKIYSSKLPQGFFYICIYAIQQDKPTTFFMFMQFNMDNPLSINILTDLGRLHYLGSLVTFLLGKWITYLIHPNDKNVQLHSSENQLLPESKCTTFLMLKRDKINVFFCLNHWRRLQHLIVLINMPC